MPWWRIDFEDFTPFGFGGESIKISDGFYIVESNSKQKAKEKINEKHAESEDIWNWEKGAEGYDRKLEEEIKGPFRTYRKAKILDYS